jgi:hypothetical protein
MKRLKEDKNDVDFTLLGNVEIYGHFRFSELVEQLCTKFRTVLLLTRCPSINISFYNIFCKVIILYKVYLTTMIYLIRPLFKYLISRNWSENF